MDGAVLGDWFAAPRDPAHVRYEALRAVFLDGDPASEVADRFGIPRGTLRNHVSSFRGLLARGETPPFFGRSDAAVRLATETARGCLRSPTPASCRSRRARGIAPGWRACSCSGRCSRGCGSTRS